MRKLLAVLVVLAVFIPLSANAAYNIYPCCLDHFPEDDFEAQWPKGIAGCTLLYDLAQDPEGYGWDSGDGDYLAMVAYIEGYEEWYAMKILGVIDLIESLETDLMAVNEAMSVVVELNAELLTIDLYYIQCGYYCTDSYIPEVIWDEYMLTH